MRPKPAPMDDKVSKESVNYRRALNPGKRRCGICTMYREGGKCTLVAGYINPGMDCDEFERRK